MTAIKLRRVNARAMCAALRFDNQTLAASATRRQADRKQWRGAHPKQTISLRGNYV